MVARRQAEGVDQAAVTHERNDRPTEFHDLLGREVRAEVVEHLLVDVVVVDEQALRVAQGGFLVSAKVAGRPITNLSDGGFVKRGSL